MIFLGHAYLGMVIHLINLQAITLALIFGKSSVEIRNSLQSLLLLPIIRMVNLSMPVFFTTTLLWYPLIYGVMFVPVYYVIQQQSITLKEIGIHYSNLNILPLAIVAGINMAIIEYKILNPLPLIENIQLPNIILITLVMFVFVGAVEEIIFRSVLITRFEKVMGNKKAVILSSVLFGVMHSGYGIKAEIIIATVFGLALGYAFQKTRSFAFILAMHGTTNVFLFGILPIIQA